MVYLTFIMWWTNLSHIKLWAVRSLRKLISTFLECRMADEHSLLSKSSEGHLRQRQGVVGVGHAAFWGWGSLRRPHSWRKFQYKY